MLLRLLLLIFRIERGSKMKSFLVIDDSRERESLYNRVFNFLKLEFAFTKRDFLRKLSQSYDGYIIDIIYEPESYEDYSFQQILEKIPNKKPIFLISSQWDKAMDQMKMKALRKCGKYNDVLGYFSWKMICESNQEEYVRDFAKEQIAHYFDMAYGAFDENQSISLLQISDIEFGNPNQISNVETERSKLIRNVRKSLRKLDMNNTKVDFICICGDIAYTGDKNQYIHAKTWLKKLGEELLINNNLENMLIVPGNHDYNFKAGAGNFVSYNRKEKDYKLIENNENLEFHEHAMYNFAKFIYELNGESSYLISPYKPIIKRTYEDYGLNFILLNPVRTKYNQEFVYGLEDDAMNYLFESAETIEEDVCNIVLSHFAPEIYSMVDPTSGATNRNIKQIADALHIKGWWCGHSHDDAFIDDQMVGNYKAVVSRSQSLMLENVERDEGSCNGFTLLKMYRENGKVVKISYYDEKNQREKVYDKLFEKE